MRVDALARQKNPKRHFFRAIGNSFHEVTWIGLEPHQIFSFCNISTNMVARGVQSFGRNGPWWAGCLKYGQNFLIKFAQTCDGQMLKISRSYLDSCLIYGYITKNLLQQIFSLSALNQTRIKISSWNFQHLFITCLCKFDSRILAIFRAACPPRPISAETLDASSDHICWDISKRKNLVRF